MIRLERVTKVFGSVTAVDAVDLDIPEGSLCVLLGPSGCGKTTTMKMINRLIAPSGGKIYVDGRDTDLVDEVTLRRSIGYVIQQIGLFPNKTIEDNICVVPDLLGWDRKKARCRAAELLEMVNLPPHTFLKRYPKELSGGQQQRVGVIRALAADPPVLLMDEPFGAIDPINRELIQDEFLKLQAALKKTIVFVSHDIDEAVKMATHIAIFRDGRLVQYDTPNSILANPINDFVADFVGSDRTLKRLRLMTVSSAMMANPPQVLKSDSLDQAMMLMEAHGHVATIIVDEGGHPQGMVRLEKARDGHGVVGDHADRLPGVINVHDDLRKAVSTMFTHHVDWLACIDEHGVYRGYITQRGIAQRLSSAHTG